MSWPAVVIKTEGEEKLGLWERGVYVCRVRAGERAGKKTGGKFGTAHYVPDYQSKTFFFFFFFLVHARTGEREIQTCDFRFIRCDL
jgi:hypothetical protein